MLASKYQLIMFIFHKWWCQLLFSPLPIKEDKREYLFTNPYYSINNFVKNLPLKQKPVSLAINKQSCIWREIHMTRRHIRKNMHTYLVIEILKLTCIYYKIAGASVSIILFIWRMFNIDGTAIFIFFFCIVFVT